MFIAGGARSPVQFNRAKSYELFVTSAPTGGRFVQEVNAVTLAVEHKHPDVLSAVWAPLAFDPKGAARRDARYLTVLGRLAAGRTLEDAKSQVAVVAQRLEQPNLRILDCRFYFDDLEKGRLIFRHKDSGSAGPRPVARRPQFRRR